MGQQITENDLVDAWAAGIIDGEGCITIKRAEGRYYSMMVIVGQSGTDMPLMLQKLLLHYGGNCSRQPTDLRGRTQKWAWQVVGQAAEDVLTHIRPYLIQKQDQADVALRFRRTIGCPGQRMTAEHRANAEAAYSELRAMKNYKKRHPQWRIRDKDKQCSRS